ncbi:had-Superfamily hydrolase, subfamily IA, variant 3 [Arthrobacter sp. Hiyo1]|nr:had-Superfamily hydrolase, subfamily IA, variant 3 [Arthrobacter sp. Hiyo1]
MLASATQPFVKAELKAALWDMDGTLVDTEPYWIAAERTLVESYGGAWSHEQAMQLVGQSLMHSAGILQKAGVNLEKREIVDSLSARSSTASASRCRGGPVPRSCWTSCINRASAAPS